MHNNRGRTGGPRRVRIASKAPIGARFPDRVYIVKVDQQAHDPVRIALTYL